MFTFIKKLFGFDQPTMKEAGVQIEQAPYKVPEPVAVTPTPLVVEPISVSTVETVVVIPEAVVPAAVVEQTQAAVKPKAPAKAKTATPKKPRKPKLK
jgi:hypothetical protein